MAMDPKINPETVAKIRRPAVAGYFYPEATASLRQEIIKLCGKQGAAKQAVAIIVPHGSFNHSGAVLAQTLAQTVIPRRCILVGPTHTGSFMPWSVLANGWYRTPLGDVPVDVPLCEALRSRCPFLEVDAWSQKGEHSIEVVVPLLQQLGPKDLTIVPIITGSDDDNQISMLAHAIAQVIRMVEEPVLLIASANLSHYEPKETVVQQDQALLSCISALDASALQALAREEGFRVCGAGTIAVALEAAKQLSAKTAQPVAYATSADAGGDPDSAIGFAGIQLI